MEQKTKCTTLQPGDGKHDLRSSLPIVILSEALAVPFRPAFFAPDGDERTQSKDLLCRSHRRKYLGCPTQENAVGICVRLS